jgi:uncharacterized membrane protein
MIDPCDELIFRTRITPHRSLDARRVRLLLLIFAGCCAASSIPFVVLGAWPVAGFLGLDVLLLFVAFRLNVRSARAYEDVAVTPVELSVERVSPTGKRRAWRFSPGFVRLEREEMEDYGVTRLDLVSRGRRVEVAAALGPQARADFARDLALALAQARRGPRFS